MNNITLVTGIWDLNRSNAPEGWNRDFSHYKSKFIELLTATQHINLCVFIDKENEQLVWDYRKKENTKVYYHSKEDFSGNFFPFFDRVQEIRNSPEWKDQVGWLKDSTQSTMEFYNPMVMSKMFMLHNAKIFNPFNDDYYYWIDGGITNTIHYGYFSHDKVIENVPNICDKFLFVCFPYETTTEIHGFDIKGMKKYCKSENVDRVARGGFFGGHKDYIAKTNEIYYGLLNDSLNDGYMGTEESIFTIMTYLYPETFKFELIENNGLLGTFFENLKNNFINLSKPKSIEDNKLVLYINTFNCPKQLELLINSFHQHDVRFLQDTKIILINNSTDDILQCDYDLLVNKYNMTEIKMGNLGVCGGRQYAAEHFDALNNKYMIFFEDDMLLDLSDTKCSFGFSKNVNNLFTNMQRIMDIEKYDFLKLTFSEFYGDNHLQWSWHNVPSPRKEEYFGNINEKPLTKFSHIKSYDKVPYIEGEVYYSNWPHIIGKSGNKKMFLDTKWTYPYEQTWMSHFYTLTLEKTIKPAILLSSPITHNRVYFYEGSQRKEN
jgi:hypothetical protein